MYPYITLDQNDSLIVVFTPDQYDAIAKLVIKHKANIQLLNQSESLVSQQDSIISYYQRQDMLSKDIQIRQQQKFETLEQIFRNSASDNAALITQNIRLTEDLNKAKKQRNQYRSYLIGAGAVAAFYGIIKYSTILNR